MTDTIQTKKTDSVCASTANVDPLDELIMTKLPFAEHCLQTCVIQLKPFANHDIFKDIKEYVTYLFKIIAETPKLTELEKSRYKLGEMGNNKDTGISEIHFAHPDPSVLQNIIVTYLLQKHRDSGINTVEVYVKTLTTAPLFPAYQLLRDIVESADGKSCFDAVPRPIKTMIDT